MPEAILTLSASFLTFILQVVVTYVHEGIPLREGIAKFHT